VQTPDFPTGGAGGGRSRFIVASRRVRGAHVRGVIAEEAQPADTPASAGATAAGTGKSGMKLHLQVTSPIENLPMRSESKQGLPQKPSSFRRCQELSMIYVTRNAGAPRSVLTYSLEAPTKQACQLLRISGASSREAGYAPSHVGQAHVLQRRPTAIGTLDGRQKDRRTAGRSLF
jgi:hypothetical protein